MSGQDYDKDLYLMIVGSGNTTRANFEDNVEDFIFGDRDSREVTLVIPYTTEIGKGLDTVLNQWAVGADRNEPNYPIVAFVEPEAGHRSISSAKDSTLLEETHGVHADSLALEEAMSYLVERKKDNQEVAVVVLYDQEKDIRLVGDIKNYNGIPVYNIDGMIDAFPGFKTTDELLEEERKREEFETKEKIRIAAEKEQEKAQETETKPAPRKRVAKKAAEPVEKPLTGRRTTKKAVAKVEPQEEPPKAVEAILAEESQLPKELEPVKDLTVPASDVPDLWKDVAHAQAQVSVPDGKVAVSKESLVQLGEGIKEMSEAYSKTIAALTDMIREQA